MICRVFLKCQIKYEFREFKEGRQQNNLRVSSESYLRPFQYKVLNNILFTNDILFKIGYVPSPSFSSCHDNTETNLVPRSHSVTGNVRSGKVRQYTIFHWPLKKGCGNEIDAPIGLSRGVRNEGLVFASSCAVLNKYQLCGGKFCFSRRRKSFTVKENHFKNLRRLC